MERKLPVPEEVTSVSVSVSVSVGGKGKRLELREVIEKSLLRFLDLHSFKLRSVLAELTLTLATSSDTGNFFECLSLLPCFSRLSFSGMDICRLSFPRSCDADC
jgi:hypothetical protein